MLIADVQNACVELVNASTPGNAYGAVGGLGSEKFKSGEFDFWIRAADVSVYGQILKAQGEGRRVGALTTSVVAHGSTIPTHVGPIDAVFMTVTGGYYAGTRVPEQAPPMQIEDENRNPQSNPAIKPHFFIEGNTVFHNGTGLVAGGASAATLTVRYATLTYSSGGTSLQSPDEAVMAVAALALEMLITKDGQRTSAGGLYAGTYRFEMTRLGMPEQQQEQAA